MLFIQQHNNEFLTGNCKIMMMGNLMTNLLHVFMYLQ